MPPTGAHVLIGIALARRVARPALIVGLILGCVLPDIDLVASVGAFIATGDQTLTLSMHRSLTHSAVLFLPLAVAGLVITATQRSKTPTDRKITIDPETETRRPWSGAALGPFLFALGIGMGVHSLLDLLYFSSVRLFFPLWPGEVALMPWTYEILPTVGQKWWSAGDLMTDTILYLVIAHWSVTLGTDARRAKRLRIFAWCALVYFAGLMVLAPTVPAITMEQFIVLTYACGMLVIPVSVAAPFLFRRTLVRYCRSAFVRRHRGPRHTTLRPHGHSRFK